ncbi:MAG TPA: type VI secretion system accessory protein TagJ [Pirellulales bacterium]|jgi:type VI secretion system protein ImpE|nr:type VI secretion system accessory protein TagJ [Pirellulales bacterium]
MDIKQLFADGDLTAAIAGVTQQVKSRPTDLSARTLLFELLCFAGELDRAEKQLDAIAQLDEKSEWAVQVYRNLIAAERKRRRLFSEGLKPEALLDWPPYVRLHLEAINRLREGHPDEARAALDEAEDMYPAVTGSADGRTFDDLRDCDDLLSPVLELMVLQDYLWLPLEQVRSLEITAPERPRDLLWIPVRLTLTDGAERSGYMPVRYHGSHEHADDQVKLGRLTDWSAEPGGPTTGQGMRTLLVGDEALGLLEMRNVSIVQE